MEIYIEIENKERLYIWIGKPVKARSGETWTNGVDTLGGCSMPIEKARKIFPELDLGNLKTGELKQIQCVGEKTGEEFLSSLENILGGKLSFRDELLKEWRKKYNLVIPPADRIIDRGDRKTWPKEGDYVTIYFTYQSKPVKCIGRIRKESVKVDKEGTICFPTKWSRTAEGSIISKNSYLYSAPLSTARYSTSDEIQEFLEQIINTK